MLSEKSHKVDIGDTRLHVVERGTGYPILVIHGGPGLDYHEFADYLDPLTDNYRLILIDQRHHGLSDPAPEETWTLEQHAKDVGLLASAMGFDQYAVLGHSYGAFVALQHAVDYPGQAAQTIVSGGVPSASRYLASYVAEQLASFEPIELREQVANSWARETTVQTREEAAALLTDQLPFHFRDSYDPVIEDYVKRTADTIYAPDVLRKFSSAEYGGIEVEERLGQVTQPVLVLAGRYDRACSVAAAEAIAAGIPHARLVVFEKSAHMTFVEENDAYLATVREFLNEYGS